MAKPTLKDRLALIEGYADDFTTHWIDDDTPEEQDAADKAQEKIAQASTEIAKAFTAASAMLAALKEVREWAAVLGGWDAPCWDAVRTAIAQAEAAGIKTGDE